MANVTNHAYAYNVSNRLGLATRPPGVTAARKKPGNTGNTPSTSAIRDVLMPRIRAAALPALP